MPKLVHLLARNAAVGFTLAACFIGALVILDVGDLRTLAAASSTGAFAIGLLFFATGLTFASVQMGVAVMLLGQHDRGGGKTAKARDGVPPQAMSLRMFERRH